MMPRLMMPEKTPETTRTMPETTTMTNLVTVTNLEARRALLQAALSLDLTATLAVMNLHPAHRNLHLLRLSLVPTLVLLRPSLVLLRLSLVPTLVLLLLSLVLLRLSLVPTLVLLLLLSLVPTLAPTAMRTLSL